MPPGQDFMQDQKLFQPGPQGGGSCSDQPGVNTPRSAAFDPTLGSCVGRTHSSPVMQLSCSFPPRAPPRRCTPRPCAGPTGVTNVSDEEKINQLFLLLVCVDLLPQAIANRLLDCYSDKTIIVFSPFSDNSTREGWISLIAALVFAQSVRR